MTHDFHHLLDSRDGLALGEHVNAGDISREALLEAVIERLERVEPSLNAVVDRLYDTAREESRRPRATGQLFAGVPTLIKDLFSPLRGARMTQGSQVSGNVRADFDAEAVARLRHAGCVLMGTSTSPEFGTSYTTESTRHGATRNPWDIERSAGGSSGGAAALVAARVVPFAHGNDGGGSLRVPASCCGVFGFKPSRGVMPSGPMAGEGWGGMGTSHAITRSVRDSAALLDVTAGSDMGAPYAAPASPFSCLEATRRDPGTLSIALIEGPTLAPEAAEVARQTAALCESLGHRVEVVRLPLDWDELYQRCFDIIGPSTQELLDTIGHMRGQPVSNEEIEPRTRVMLRERGRLDATRYIAAINYIHALGRKIAGTMLDFDVLLSPTLARKPPMIGTLDAFDDRLTLDEVIHAFHSYCPFTALFNATGQPAMSVPLYWTEDGLPLGSHFAGRFGQENLLFSLAAQLEQERPWAGRVPGVNACSR
ncbi:6-aminohexanoate-cyclic-dimer hydrolase [Kushneria pakistanensis]|uniref:6-aminohexanoate-cyclic-dimer hydrolase n=1 Tax=Kushneria pakistanensis TaxID=1508770 RepID=A0ABQ3FGK7_9GAMM|nr:amidase [Kushneria pakistanensis]GHC23200.1 6-aminohexanoate-cyclic-dimer hydrolase [Kushneria pakistanensis]